MKTKFLLAISGTFLRTMKQYTSDKEACIKKYDMQNLIDKDIRIYKPGSFFHHNDLLFSAFHFKSQLNKGKSTLYDVLGLERTNTIFIDSGGYSISTGAVDKDKWTSKDAFELSINNGNIFPILDIPVTPSASFDDCLKSSMDSAVYYKANQPHKGEIILNVAHGRNLTEVKTWVDKISKIELDGWALGSSHGGNPKEIVKGLFFMLTSGVLKDSKAFHVFGVSSASMIIYFAALKHAIKKSNLGLNFDITFDSSYPLRAAAFGHFFQFTKFDGFSNITLTNQVDWNKLSDDDFEDGFFCDCPVCNEIKDFKQMVLSPMAGQGEFILWNQLHNTYQQKRYIRQISSLVEMCCDIPELLPHVFPAQIGRNISVIIEAFDNPTIGEELINRKFIAKDVDNGDATLDDFFE